MLKSFLSIVLMFAFLSSTQGVQVFKHYCGDYLEGISVYIQSNPCADEGGEDACNKGKKSSCCDDEVEFYQLKIDLIKHSQEKHEYKLLPVVELVAEEHFIELFLEKDFLDLLSRPPPLSKIPIYKRLHRFTFYG